MLGFGTFCVINVLTERLKWRPMPDKKREVGYAITYKVIWANQKTQSFVYPWLRALATRFPAIMSGIGRHFKRSVDTSIIV